MQREGWYRRHLKRQETALAVLNSHGPMQAAASQSAFKIFNHTFAILSPHIFGSHFLLIECTVFYQHFQLFDQDVPFFTNMYFTSTCMRSVFNMRYDKLGCTKLHWYCTNDSQCFVTVVLRELGMSKKRRRKMNSLSNLKRKWKRRNTQIHLNVSMLPETRWTHCGTLLVGIDSPDTVVVTLLQICF